MTEDPARLAAIDQELAAMNDRLSRNARARMRGDIATAVVALVVAATVAIGRPQVQWWQFAAAALVVALLSAGSYVQGLMLRSYRDENSRLRAGER